jgi:hypothetical protein
MPKKGNSVKTALHVLLVKKLRKHTIDKIEVKKINYSENGEAI